MISPSLSESAANRECFLCAQVQTWVRTRVRSPLAVLTPNLSPNLSSLLTGSVFSVLRFEPESELESARLSLCWHRTWVRTWVCCQQGVFFPCSGSNLSPNSSPLASCCADTEPESEPEFARLWLRFYRAWVRTQICFLLPSVSCQSSMWASAQWFLAHFRSHIGRQICHTFTLLLDVTLWQGSRPEDLMNYTSVHLLRLLYW